MESCHIAHDCKIGNSKSFANSTLLTGIVVEDYVHTAGAVVVHQFCHLGSFSFIGGGSVMRILRMAYQRIFMPSDVNSVGFKDRLAKQEQHETMAGVPAVLSMIQSIRDCFAENRRGICKFRHWNTS